MEYLNRTHLNNKMLSLTYIFFRINEFILKSIGNDHPAQDMKDLCRHLNLIREAAEEEGPVSYCSITEGGVSSRQRMVEERKMIGRRQHKQDHLSYLILTFSFVLVFIYLFILGKNIEQLSTIFY